MIYIVLLSSDKFDRINDAEYIENANYDSISDLYESLHSLIGYGEAAGEELTSADVLVYTLRDFMGAFNDEEITDSLWWFTYVNIK